MGELVGIYWKPVYKTIRIRFGKTNEEAKDLTQSFLTMLLERDALEGFSASRGTFRTYLRTLLDRFVANEHKASHRLKRGGNLTAVDFEEAEAELSSSAAVSPDELLHQEWIRSVLERSVDQLEAELRREGKHEYMVLFRRYDLDGSDQSYRQLATELGTTESTVTNRLAFARRRFRQIVLDVVRSVTASDEEFRQEVRALLGVEP